MYPNRMCFALILPLAALSLAACSDSSSTDSGGAHDAGPTEDTGGKHDAASPDGANANDATSGDDAGATDAGGAGHDFASAAHITVGDANGRTDVIDPPGDVDFYTFEANEGDWIAIATSANMNMLDPLDTVLVLYDSSREILALSDDATPYTNTNSELIVRIPRTDRWYITVQDYSTATGETPRGDPLFVYDVIVLRSAPATSPVVAGDEERGDDDASAIDAKFVDDFGILVGTFRDTNDVDVFRVTVTGTTAVRLAAVVMPTGTGDDENRNGSTAKPGEMWITRTNSTEKIARIDMATYAVDTIAPSITAGQYLLWIAHRGTSTGANDFYVVKLFRGNDNPPEASDMTNGDPAHAEPIDMSGTLGGRRGFLLSTLTDGDVDVFSFDVQDETEELTVLCNSRTQGSGVLGLTVELRDPDGELAQPALVEEPEDGIELVADSLAVGTHYLRLRKTGQAPDVTGNWARCGVMLERP